jgi:hypothetical protein
MLERLCFPLVVSVEALAHEDEMYSRAPAESPRVYLPAIVTTARLKLCDLDSSEITIDDGKLKSAQFSDAKFVRFRKQLSGKPSSLKRFRFVDDETFASAKESTVYVINVNHLVHFLRYLDVDVPSYARHWPAD